MMPVIPERMRAMVVERPGPPEVLQLQELPTPRPGPGEALVEVHTVTVNQSLDIGVRSGRYDKIPPLPVILGCDPSGVVVELGQGLTEPAVGTRVAINGLRDGGYREYIAVPAEKLVSIPDGVSFAVASIVTRHFPMAYHLAREASLQPGEWLLVMGAAGGLGSAAVQVGKMLGARVIAGAGSNGRVALALDKGADFGVNYREADLETEVLRITNGHGVDVAFENSSDPVLWPAAQRCLADKGRLMTGGAHAGGLVMLDTRILYHRHQRVIGTAGGRREDAEAALAAAARGKLKVDIFKTFPLAELPQAHALAESGQALGKVVIQVRPQLV